MVVTALLALTRGPRSAAAVSAARGSLPSAASAMSSDEASEDTLALAEERLAGVAASLSLGTRNFTKWLKTKLLDSLKEVIDNWSKNLLGLHYPVKVRAFLGGEGVWQPSLRR